MLTMGFAEDVERILSETPEYKQVALFSATMPPAIRKLTTKYLHDPFEVTAKAKTATAENISQRYIQVAGPRKMDALTRVLEVEPFEAMIVFVRTKQATEEVAEKLRARGLFRGRHQRRHPAGRSASGPSPRSKRRRQRHRHPGRHRRRGPRAGRRADIACAQLRHPARHRVLRAPDRAHRPGRAVGDRAAVRLPAGTPPAQVDRKGDAANAHRGRTAHRRGRQRAAGGEVRRFHHRRARRSGNRAVPPSGRGLRTRARRPDGRHRRGAGAAVPRRRGVPDGARTAARAAANATDRPADRPRKPRGRQTAFTTYRIAVGKRHKIGPGAIVGAIANEGGLHRSDFGHIAIGPDFSLVELPAKLPRATLKKLENTRISGVLINLRPDRSARQSRRDSGKPRRKRAG